MAYNNGFPVNYPYYQQPMLPTQYQQPMVLQQQQLMNQSQLQQNNNFVWIQGEEGAKAYMVAPGSTVLLMDSENSVFYLKSSSADGIPQLRIFDYTERTQTKPEIIDQDYKKEDKRFDDFEKRISSLGDKIADLEEQLLDIATRPTDNKKGGGK